MAAAELRVQVPPYLQVMREHVVKYLSTNTPGEARASTSRTFINLNFPLPQRDEILVNEMKKESDR